MYQSKGRKTVFSKTGFLTKRIDTSWEDLRWVETTRSQKTHRDDLRRFETIWDDSIVSNRLETCQIVSMGFLASSGLVSSQIISTRIDTFRQSLKNQSYGLWIQRYVIPFQGQQFAPPHFESHLVIRRSNGDDVLGMQANGWDPISNLDSWETAALIGCSFRKKRSSQPCSVLNEMQ